MMAEVGVLIIYFSFNAFVFIQVISTLLLPGQELLKQNLY